MTLRGRILSLAAPFAVAVCWDTLILGARVLGLYKTIHENASSFRQPDAMENLERALAEHMLWQADQDRRAA